MVPEVQANGFGYSETSLGPDRVEVRYATPEIDLPVDEERRSVALMEQKQKAFDLALWRAAQIALADGYAYLKVEQDTRDADVSVSQENVPTATGQYSVYGPGGMLYPGWAYQPGPRFGRPGIATPFILYDDPFSYRVRLQVTGRIIAKLTVALAKAPKADTLDAKATADRLAKQYAGATY